MKCPDRIAIDADGFGWRVWNGSDYWSMVPTNPDNSPIPQPVTWFVPEAEVERLRGLLPEVERLRALLVDCGTRHNEGSPEDDPELDEHYGPCCDEGTCDSRPVEPGACGDPACPVLHADPENPVHPPWYVDSRTGAAKLAPITVNVENLPAVESCMKRLADLGGFLDRLHDEAFPSDPYLLGRLHAEMERLGYGQVRDDGE